MIKSFCGDMGKSVILSYFPSLRNYLAYLGSSSNISKGWSLMYLTSSI